MDFLGFKSKEEDPDVWMRPATGKDGSLIYEYVLLYTDDCLVVSENAESILKQEIGKYFELEPESIGPPSLYLGGQLCEVVLESVEKAWAFGSSQYFQVATKNVEEYLEKIDKSLKPTAIDVLLKGYRPEIDISPELGPQPSSEG
jgi:hypothetical protein